MLISFRSLQLSFKWNEFYGHINMLYLFIVANGTTIPKHGQNPSVSAADEIWTNAYEGKFKPTACYPIMYVSFHCSISYYSFPLTTHS